MVTVYNKGKRTIQTKEGNLTPQTQHHVSEEIAKILKAQYSNEFEFLVSKEEKQDAPKRGRPSKE